MMIQNQKYQKNNGWTVVENLETDNESKKQKVWSEKHGETRAAGSKNCHLKIKQSCSKHQRYNSEIMKNMKSLLQENCWWHKTW